MRGPARLRLVRLHVEGFGRLADYVLEPPAEPGVLVVAPNEAGKSTLTAAIFHGLFGFSDKSEEEARRPWGGGPYAVALEWALGERSTCAIRRDFDTQRVAVEWRTDGAIDRRWEGEPNPRGRSGDRAAYDDELRRLLGFVSSEVFRQTAFVSPGAAAVRPLAAELLRLLSGSERADFRAALAEFEAGWYHLTRADIADPQRPVKHKARQLEELDERRAELVARRENARGGRDARRGAEEELAQVHRRIAELERDVAGREETARAIERTRRIREEIGDAERLRQEMDRGIERFVEWERRVREKAAALEPLVRYLRYPRDFADRVRRLRDLREQVSRRAAEGAEAESEVLRAPRPGAPLGLGAAGVAAATIGLVLAALGTGGAAGYAAVAVGVALAAFGLGWAWVRRSRRRERVVRWTALQAEAARLDRERAAVAETLPFDSSAPDLDLHLERWERAHQLRAELDGMQEARPALGDRETLERDRRSVKEERLDVLRLEQRRLLERHPYLEIGADYERQFLQDERHRVEERARLETRELQLRRRLADLPVAADDPHRLAAEIARIDEETARLRLERDAHRLAWRILTECKDEFVQVMTHRLGRRIGRVFEAMTGGRYSAVEIHPVSLELSVDGIEKRGIPAESLSRGTRDQLYFALRIALLQELAADRALPLVLDDPFLHFDLERLGRAEETLRRLGSFHQVLLLTHDARVAGWSSFPQRRLPAVGAGAVASPSAD